jgi:hypothetical protein
MLPAQDLRGGVPDHQAATNATTQAAAAAAAAAAASWMWEPGETTRLRLRELFVMIDRSESGSMSSVELMHMLRNLGEDVSDGVVGEMIDLVDVDGSQEVNFSEFYDVLTGARPLRSRSVVAAKVAEGRVRSIRDMRAKFDEIVRQSPAHSRPRPYTRD